MRGGINKVFFDGLYLPLLKTLKVQFSSISSLVLTSQTLPSIETIEITECNRLTNIVGLSDLSSLKQLHINGCRYSQFGTNEWLPNELLELDISGCPQLHEWEQLEIKKNKNIDPRFVSF